MKNISIFLLFIFLNFRGFATTWYTIASGDPNVYSNWNSSSGGGGSTPTTFATTGDVWTIQNNMTFSAGATWTVGGSITVNSSTVTATSGTTTINCANLSLTGSSLMTSASGAVYYNLTGNLSVANTSQFTNSSSENYMYFANTSSSLGSPQTITYSSSKYGSYTNYNINAGCTVQLASSMPINSSSDMYVYGTLVVPAAYALTSSGYFYMESGSTMYIANTAGITTGVTGAVQVTGGRFFAGTANYVYNGSSAQATGNACPTAFTSPGSLTINNSAGVALTSATTFATGDTVNLESGPFTITAGLTLNAGAYIQRDNGTFASAPVFAGAVNVTYKNLGVNTSAVTAGIELPASASKLHNLIVNKTSAIITLSAATTVNGNLSLIAGMLADGGKVITLAGNILGAGTHSSSAGGSVSMSGTVVQTISNVTLGNLILNNNAGFSLSATPTTINGVLTMTSGTLAIGANNLAFGPSAGAIAGTPSSSVMIIADSTGNVIKYYNSNGSFLFPIGDKLANYTPITLNFTGSNGYTSGISNVSVNMTALKEPHNPATVDYIKRYWTVGLNSINTPNYSVAATFVSGDVVGTEANVEMELYAGSLPWLAYAGVPVTHTINATSVATGGNFTGMSSANPSVSVSPSVATTCVGSNGITFTAIGSGTPTFSYKWSPAACLSATTGAIVVFTPTVGGSYVYTVTATDASSFTSTNTVTVTVSANNQWNGVSSMDWNTSANWSCGNVPTATTAVVVPGASSYSFSPVLASGTESVGSLIVSAGANLSLNSGAQLKVTGSVMNNGSIDGSGVLYLNGSSPQVLSGSGTVGNMTLANSAGAVISGTSDVVGVTGTLLLNAGTLTTYNGTSYGRLRLISNASGSGCIGPVVSGTVSGTVEIQQYVPGGRRAYRFIAHPYKSAIPLSQIQNCIDITGAGGSGNGFTTTSSNSPSAYWYNTVIANSSLGSDIGWQAFTNTNGADSNAFNKDEGIRLFFRGAKGTGLDGSTYTVAAVTYTTSGTVNMGSHDITLFKGSAPNEDYNLVGNPYPAVTDIGSVINAASTGGLLTGAAFYVWNPYLGTSGQFVAEPIGGSYYLGANESFEVRTSANGNTLHFTENNKGSSVSDALMRAATNDNITLYIYDESYHPWDMLHINFNAAATDNEDSKYDGAKAPSPASLNFYSLSADNSKLSLDARPFSDGKVIPLGIKSSYTQDFIIKAQSVAVPDNGQVYLHDKYLQTYTPLQQGTEYKFTITKDAASQSDSRFELTMKKAGAAIAQAAGNLDVQMVPNPATNEVSITYTTSGKEKISIRIVNVEGVTVLGEELNAAQNGTTKVDLNGLASGVYMVELSSGDSKIVNRLIKE